MQIKIIIGAGFGDEGKGLMTDYFAANSTNPVVVRFNGGAQAGHTVVTPEGKRHVFNHFGSGMLAGADTYLGPEFIVNPLLFRREHAAIKKDFGDSTKTYAHIFSQVTTPYDMLLNLATEEARGDGRHGSCGVGIHETMLRNKLVDSICVLELNRIECLVYKLKHLCLDYFPKRLAELNNDAVSAKYLPMINSAATLLNFLDDVQYFNHHTGAYDTSSSSALLDYDTIIFEGAQGLLLDQNSEFFPHVTHSNTGISNAMAMIHSLHLGAAPIEIVYVTRAYMTKHGAGPFPTEIDRLPGCKVHDDTNLPHESQGVLRYGLLDVELLKRGIKKDLSDLMFSAHAEVRLAVTCLDQMDSHIDVAERYGSFPPIPRDHFSAYLADKLEINLGYESWGAERDKVRVIKDLRARSAAGE